MVLTDRVALPPAVTEAGLTVAVTPAGAPVTVSARLCAEPEVTPVAMLAVVALPARTEPAAGEALTEKSLTGVVEPLVYGAKMWLKSQVPWAMPEQLSEPAVPTQPPLSRWSAQNESVLTPLESAQL